MIVAVDRLASTFTFEIFEIPVTSWISSRHSHVVSRVSAEGADRKSLRYGTHLFCSDSVSACWSWLFPWWHVSSNPVQNRVSVLQCHQHHDQESPFWCKVGRKNNVITYRFRQLSVQESFLVCNCRGLLIVHLVSSSSMLSVGFGQRVGSYSGCSLWAATHCSKSKQWLVSQFRLPTSINPHYLRQVSSISAN